MWPPRAPRRELSRWNAVEQPGRAEWVVTRIVKECMRLHTVALSLTRCAIEVQQPGRRDGARRARSSRWQRRSRPPRQQSNSSVASRFKQLAARRHDRRRSRELAAGDASRPARLQSNILRLCRPLQLDWPARPVAGEEACQLSVGRLHRTSCAATDTRKLWNGRRERISRRGCCAATVRTEGLTLAIPTAAHVVAATNSDQRSCRVSATSAAGASRATFAVTVATASTWMKTSGVRVAIARRSYVSAVGTKSQLAPAVKKQSSEVKTFRA